MKNQSDGVSILRNAAVYLTEQYPHIRRDVLRKSHERIAAEILGCLSDLLMLRDWNFFPNTAKKLDLWGK